MSSIMELIGPELSKLSALGLEKLPYLTVYTRGSAYKDHLAPNLGKTFMSNRILMSLIMGPIGPEQLELFAIEL